MPVIIIKIPADLRATVLLEANRVLESNPLTLASFDAEKISRTTEVHANISRASDAFEC